MYFTAHDASVALEILAAAGLAAEAKSASRPSTGVRYLLSVEAPHLPRHGKEMPTVQIRTPRELLGWGATQVEVDLMNQYESIG